MDVKTTLTTVAGTNTVALPTDMEDPTTWGTPDCEFLTNGNVPVVDAGNHVGVGVFGQLKTVLSWAALLPWRLRIFRNWPAGSRGGP